MYIHIQFTAETTCIWLRTKMPWPLLHFHPLLPNGIHACSAQTFSWLCSWYIPNKASFQPYAAGGYVGQYKIMQKSWKITETLAYGYSYESTQWELSNEYQHDRVWLVFRNISVIVLWTKVASASEGLIWQVLENIWRRNIHQESTYNPSWSHEYSYYDNNPTMAIEAMALTQRVINNLLT